jgi:DNA-binding NarL/FixJ family response regulator
MSSSKINIMMVDDHPLIIDGLKSYFSNFETIHLVDTANSIKQALEKLKTISSIVKVMIVDYSLSDGTADVLIKEVKQHYPNISIIMLSTHEDISLISKMMKSGISGFVSKSNPPSVIYDAICRVSDGDIFLNHDLLKKMYLFENNLSTNEIRLLTGREKEVLKYLLESKTLQEISGILIISISTVETHKKNIFSKFNVHSISELINRVSEFKHLL